MKYHLYLFNANPPDLSANRAVQSFAAFAQPVPEVVRVFECFADGLDFCPLAPASFGVTIYPTLIISLVTGQSSRGTTVHPVRRLIGGGITRARILEQLQELRNTPPIVQHGGGEGNYDGGGQWEGSLLNLLLPPWLLMAATLVAGYKTVTGKSAAYKTVYGSLATLGILSWYQLPPERRRFLPGLGRTTSPHKLLNHPNHDPDHFNRITGGNQPGALPPGKKPTRSHIGTTTSSDLRSPNTGSPGHHDCGNRYCGHSARSAGYSSTNVLGHGLL
ncbi:MAG: hypothetical protein AAFZ52_13915 [Bacteroidota bacterium]